MNESTSSPPPLPEPTLPAAEPQPLSPAKRWQRRRKLLMRASVLLLGAAAFWFLLLHVTLLVLLDSKTPDYVEVGADKIYLVEKTLYHAELDQEVVLLGMAHIGDAAFYQSINERLDDPGLILWEGVTDQHGLLGSGTAKPYGQFSNVLGLVQQGRFDQPKEKMVWADVDTSALKTESLEILNVLFGIMTSVGDRETFRERVAEFGRMEAANPGLEKRLMADLIDTRNERLLEVIAEHPDAERLFVPWGAWHMPGVEAELLERGFVIADETRRQVTAMSRVYGGAFRALLRGLQMNKDEVQ